MAFLPAFLVLTACAHAHWSKLPDFAACDLRDAEACDRLGTLFHYGVTVPLDSRASRDYYRRACEAGKFRRCWLLANELSASDRREAEHLWRNACGAGFAPGCGSLGEALLDRDHREAAALLRRACEEGDDGACPRELGRHLLDRCAQRERRACERLETCLQIGACTMPAPLRKLMPRPPEERRGDQA